MTFLRPLLLPAIAAFAITLPSHGQTVLRSGSFEMRITAHPFRFAFFFPALAVSDILCRT